MNLPVEYYLLVDESGRVVIILESVPFQPAAYVPYMVLVAEASDLHSLLDYETLMRLKAVWKRE